MENPTSDIKQAIKQLQQAASWLAKLNVDAESLYKIISKLRKELEEAA